MQAVAQLLAEFCGKETDYLAHDKGRAQDELVITGYEPESNPNSLMLVMADMGKTMQLEESFARLVC